MLFRQIEGDAIDIGRGVNLAGQTAVVQTIRGRGLQRILLERLLVGQSRQKVGMNIDVTRRAIADAAATRHDPLDVVLDRAVHRRPALGDHDILLASIIGNETNPYGGLAFHLTASPEGAANDMRADARDSKYERLARRLADGPPVAIPNRLFRHHPRATDTRHIGQGEIVVTVFLVHAARRAKDDVRKGAFHHF